MNQIIIILRGNLNKPKYLPEDEVEDINKNKKIILTLIYIF
jgi:hypothetical protein